MIMKPEKTYSWVFRYCDVMSGSVCYRVYHALTVDDVNFLADKFCEANSNFRLDVFKFQFRKMSSSG